MLLALLQIGAVCSFGQSVGIGTPTPNASSQLDISSTTKGLLVPRMTQSERDIILSPAQGLLIFNTTTNSFQYYNSVTWINISHSGIINGTANRVAKFNSPWGLTPGLMTDNNAGVSISTANTVADNSALLDMSSNNKGILIPRMLSTERTAILSPAKGLMVFDNTTSTFWFYNGTVWTEMTSGGTGNWNLLANDIYNSNTGNVGIGASTPSAKLTVNGDAIINTGLRVGISTNDAKLVVVGNGSTSSSSTMILKNNLQDTLIRLQDNGRMSIGYNGSLGRPLNIGGDGINFYTATKTFGGAVFPTDTTLVLWSNSGANNYLVLQPVWGNTGIGTFTPNAKLHVNGTMLMGTSSARIATGYLLSVDGKAIAEEFRVLNSASWPDYVFGSNYKLMPLDVLECFIKNNKHLPNIPPAAEIEKEGILLGDISKRLIEKVEELTLYVIELKKEIINLKKGLNY